jgi:hypothetical protein
MPEMVPAVVEIRDKPSGKWQEVKPQDPPPDLAAPRESIIELWTSKGRPVIHLGPGENCEKIETLLSHNDLSAKNVEAINKWYIDNGGK